MVAVFPSTSDDPNPDIRGLLSATQLRPFIHNGNVVNVGMKITREGQALVNAAAPNRSDRVDGDLQPHALYLQ